MVALKADSINRSGRIVWVVLVAGATIYPRKKKRGRPRGSKKGQSLMAQSVEVDVRIAVNGDLGSKKKRIPKVLSTLSEVPSAVPVPMPPCPSLKGKEIA